MISLKFAFSCVSALALFCTLGGCANREHIRDDYGLHTREFQQKQRVHAQASPRGTGGLDSEEAAVIHGSYHKQMGGAAPANDQKSQQVLILGEPKHDEGNR